MLRQCVTSSFQYQDAVTIGLVGIQQVLCKHSTKTAAADDDRVERAGIALGTSVRPLCVLIDTLERLVESVAHVPAEDIDGKIR